MARATDDLVDDGIQPAYVDRRVRDWRDRILALYRDVEAWAAPRFRCSVADSAVMHEQLMRDAGLPAVALPVLTLTDAGDWRASFEPRGLWIVGTNGRIDFKTRSGKWLIFDASDAFRPADWWVTPLSDRKTRTPFDRTAFDRIVAGDA